MKRYIFCILLVMCFSVAHGQSDKFDRLKQNIEQKIKLNQWDEVLLLAPDLMIEDVTKGDGYYYTALAFQRLGNEENAKKYINKAKSFTDVALTEKIKLLEQAISSKKELQLSLKSAIDFESSKDKKAAADAWYQAWQYDQYKIEYALNAVSHYLDLKEYEKALKVLNEPLVYMDPEAKELVKKINQTPKMINVNGYASAIADGDKYLKQENYSNAKASYEKAEKFKPSDTYATSKIREMTEEIAWKKAKESSYITETENYVNQYPYGKYADNANATIKRSYLSIAENAYKQSDENKLIDYLNKYTLRYSRDEGVQKIKNLLMKYYLERGNKKKDEKNWQEAKSSYQAYLKIAANGNDAAYCKKSIKKCDWKLKQRSNGFIAYSYDTLSPIGISMGRLNKNGVGVYTTFKVNSGIFTSLNGTIDNNGKTSLTRFNEASTHTRLNEIRNANASASAGLTIKLVYPLFMYAGGGVIYTTQYDKWEATDPDYIYQDVDRKYWLRNKDKTKFEFFPEAGLIFKVANVAVIKYGVIYNKNIAHQIGLGFQM
jgi:tetratricopeptide (TPR) repeat protein